LLIIGKKNKEIQDGKNVFLRLEKAEEFGNRVAEMQEEKSALEESYFQMRAKYRAN